MSEFMDRKASERGPAEDGLVMGTQHSTLPRFGVQFHPESILTPEGPRIVENFLALSR